MPLETTDQIEVVKGSSSVQYGSSALNGIVHARTRWPERNSKAQTRIRTFSTFYDKAYQEDYRSAQWWQTPDTGNSFQSFPHSVGFSYYNGKHYAKRNLDVVFGAFATTDQTHIVEEFNHRIRGSVRMRWTRKSLIDSTCNFRCCPCIDTAAISSYGMEILRRFSSR